MVDLKKLLAGMTLEEKIGQLMQYNANLFLDSDAEVTGPMASLGFTKEEVDRVGSVLNFSDVSEMIAIQDEHLKNDRNKIPVIFMMDVIHGFRTIYPIPLGLGCCFDEELVKECTRMASKEATAGGVQVTFTPMVDYVRDARWGRVMETCGEEPLVNSIMGAAQVKAFQGDDLSDVENMATCIKHYAAYGGAEAGRDYNTVELSEHVLREYYLPAYKACVDAGSTMLMPSFNSLNGVPSIANSWLMKKVLKDEWGFDGVVISDYNAIGELLTHGIAADMREAAKLGFDNGCDIEMCSTAYIRYLKELVEDGTFSVEQIDEAVMRVLKLKADLGLFEDPYHGASVEKAEAVVLTPEHRDIARRAAEQSAVLLKNNGVLPFSTDARKIALIGPFADSKEVIGFWHCNGRDEESVTVREGIAALLPNAEIITVNACGNKIDDLDKSGFDEAIAAAKDADAVVLCLGEPYKYSGEGNSRTDIRLPGVQEDLAKAVAEANANTAALIFNGRPLVLTEIADTLPAILDMWFPGTECGSAAANLLFGKANPCGKLTMSFPKAVGQCPIYYNHPNTGRPKRTDENVHQGYASNYIDCGNLPLYSFGHGLSYTNFEYENMTISADTMTADDTITVSIDVKNTGKYDGKETVQLYIRDMVGSTVRPIQQLIAFEKIDLKAGESKTVTFTIDEPMLRIWDVNNELKSEKGDFKVMIGYADHFVDTKSFKLV